MSHVIVQTYTKIYLLCIWSSNVKIVLHFMSLYLTVSWGILTISLLGNCPPDSLGRAQG